MSSLADESNIADRIIGSEKLTSVFGYWPTLHDSEVIWIHLDRRPDIIGGNPVLEMLIHAFEMTDDVDARGYFVLRKHVLVHFRFCRVVDLQLADFNHQNAIFGLNIGAVRDHPIEQILLDVCVEGSYGVDATFKCRDIEVLSVTPCDEAGNSLPSS